MTHREQFANGYGISVITDGYGDANRPFELAVTFGGKVCYDCPVVDAGGVQGWLSQEDVDELVEVIRALPRKGD